MKRRAAIVLVVVGAAIVLFFVRHRRADVEAISTSVPSTIQEERTAPKSSERGPVRNLRVVGRVIDAGGGEPVADVPVTAFGAVKQAARTDRDGRFSLSMPPGTSLRLVIHGEVAGYLRAGRRLVLPDHGETFDAGDLKLLKGTLRERRALLGNRRGQTGLVLKVGPDRHVLVGQVAPGSPAERAEILPGSRIVAVDGQEVDELGLEAVRFMLMKEAGASVTLTIAPPGAQEETVSMALAPARAAAGD
jgi:membrane-associated protease RseP (regulator of RpoE activity)